MENGGEVQGRGKVIQRHKLELKRLRIRHKELGSKAKLKDGKREAEAAARAEEAELLRKHAEELSRIDSSPDATERIEENTGGGDEPVVDVFEASNFVETLKDIKISKTQQRLQRKRAQQEQEILERKRECESMPRAREVEYLAIQEELRTLGYKIHPIAADGNCLFRALEHQLISTSTIGDPNAKRDITTAAPMTPPPLAPNHKALRRMAAEFMMSRPSEFSPFLATEPAAADGGDMRSLEDYATRMCDSNDYGGDLEIRALSELLRMKIIVHCAGQKALVFGEEHTSDASKLLPLRLAFHQHLYALGAHYNSVERESKEEVALLPTLPT